MDGAFFPARTSERLADPGSAEVIVLRRALLVLQGRYRHPLTDEDVPLPPHRFVLFHDEARFSESGTSDAEGITGIFAPQTDGVAADAIWQLMLVPIFAGRADSDSYAQREGAWIDVERNAWVAPDAIDGGERSDFDALTTRPLVRVPLWTSTRHVRAGLGLLQGNPHAPQFEATGQLRTAELRPHGTGANPWVIQVDHGWVRRFIQLRFYDFAARRERALPPGVMVMAGRAGSSVVRPDGTLVIGHPTAALTPRTEYTFRTPRGTRFSLADRVLRRVPGALDMADIEHDYLVPTHWSCRGSMPWVGPADASPALRQPFEALHDEGASPAAPLCFHLDDLVLANGSDVVEPVGDRATLFDGELRIIDPQPQRPWSTRTLPGPLLPAEQWLFVRGEGLSRRTRLIEHAGQMFDVGEQRLTAVVGTPHSGRRAARPLEASASGSSRVGIVDCRYLATEYRGFVGRLAHLLVYTSTFIDVVRPGPNVGVGGKTEAMLLDAARVWTGQHPGLPDSEDGKAYALIPADGIGPTRSIVRPRFHFGARQHEAAVKGGLPSVVEVRPEAGRATAGSPMKLFLRAGSLKNPPIDPNPPKVDDPVYGPSGSTITDRHDDVPGRDFTLAHELGHYIGLPDEYLEDVEPGPGRHGFLPRFEQSSASKPWASDVTAMMRANQHPRLRYLWMLAEHAKRQSLPPDHWFAAEGPFSVMYGGDGLRTLRYEIPQTHRGFAGRPNPWTAPLETPVGRGRGLLYPMSEDEATRGPWLLPPSGGVLADGFDGVFVFVCRLWFEPRASLDGDDAWKAMRKVGSEHFRRGTMPRFCVRFPGAATFSRVALLVQPTFELSVAPSPLDDGSGAQTAAAADITVLVRGDDDPPQSGPLETPPHPMQVSLRESEVGRWLMRFALRQDLNGLVRDNGSFAARDFSEMNAALAAALGRAPGVVEAIG
ncbi:MAG: hypothetical protein K0V04_43965 [Deltaproteobacteria bacterium]|nr:hypothetical protein [Deltaproteobacteria bacterium]